MYHHINNTYHSPNIDISFFWLNHSPNQSVAEFPIPEEFLDITNRAFFPRLSAASLQTIRNKLKGDRVYGSTQHADVMEDPL